MGSSYFWGDSGLKVAFGFQDEEAEEGEENLAHLFFLNKSSTDRFNGISPRQIWEVCFRVSYWERKGIPLQIVVKRLVIGGEVSSE